VDDPRPRDLALERQRPELVGDRVTERPTAVRDRLLHLGVVRRRGRVAGPAVDVAAHPDGGLELAQARHGLGRPGAEQRVVAAEDPLLGARGARVGDDRVERGEVAVHVVEDGDHRRRV
jgi:hypothetical protein